MLGNEWGGFYNYAPLFDQNGDEILVSPVRVSQLTKDDPWIQRLCSEDPQKLSFISVRPSSNPQEFDFVSIRPSLRTVDDSDDDFIDFSELNLEGSSSSPDKLAEAIIYIQDIIHNSSSPDLVAQAQELLRECDKLRNGYTEVPCTMVNSIHYSSERDYILFATDMLKSEFGESN